MEKERYLSPEDYQTAEQNGIPRKYAYDRFYRHHWSKERAITEPVGGWWNHYKDIAAITKSGFNRRLRRGVDPYQAAVTPSKKKAR